MAYEIIVLDIDGTLTNSQKIISKPTLEALMTIQKRGHKVVLASGRPTPGILPLAEELNLKEYGGFILSYNGAKIINYQTGETVFQKVLPNEVIPSIYQIALEHNLGLMTYEDNQIITGTRIDKYMELESRINNIPIKTVEDFISYVDFDINKCLMTGEGEYLAKLEIELAKQYADQLSIYRSEPFFLEFMPKDIDKANSLKHLLGHLGLSKDQLICCGDGYNDLTMIQYAGKGVAMANAREAVKQAADYVTLSNDEDGIAHVIHEFML